MASESDNAKHNYKDVKVKEEEEDDDVDFMSDEFLVQCTKNDIRPGLLIKHSDKRRHELIKKQRDSNETNKIKNKSIQQIEEENREKYLNTEISSENKGYQLLQKMGYKPGTSIGKQQQEDKNNDSKQQDDSSRGLKVPIPIVMKRNRMGLGGEKNEAEKKKKKMNEWKEHLDKLSNTTEYRSRVQANKLNQLVLKDLRKAQACCENLDSRVNKMEPKQPWYWPERPKPKLLVDDDDEIQNTVVESDEESENDDKDEIPINEKLDQLLSYLRENYFYCIWCGAEYENSEDYSQNCPGETRDDH